MNTSNTNASFIAKNNLLKFTQAYKLSILEKGAQCKSIGELQDLLHNEKLHVAQLSKWWREFSNNLSFEKKFLKPVSGGSSVPLLTEIPVITPAVTQAVSQNSKMKESQFRKHKPLFTDDLLKKIWRGRWIFSSTVIISMLIAATYLKIITPMYSAEGVLAIDKQSPGLLFNTGKQSLQIDSTDLDLQREIEILRSYSTAEKVVDKLALDKQALFNPFIKPGFFESLFEKPPVTPVVSDELLTIDGLPSTLPAERLRLVEKFLSGLNVEQVNSSHVLKITYTTENPKVAANITNTILDTYLEERQLNNKVVSYANPPINQSFPKIAHFLSLAFAGSILLGFLSIIIRELLRRGFRSCAEIQQHTGLPSLGMLPQLNKSQSSHYTPSNYVLKYPEAPYSEAVRTLYTNMLFSRNTSTAAIGNAPRVVQFTSAYPGEGKSAAAHSLAILKRKSGMKTIIIDADIRKPNLNQSFNLAIQPGLAEYLSGHSALHQIVTRDKRTGVYLIAAGHSKKNPTEILASRRLDQLFSDLSEIFDLIIIDSPPLLAVPDAKLIASRAHMTTLVVKWGDTRKEVVEFALQQLSESGAQRLATVLTMVNTRAHSQDSFADSGVYSGQLKEYYSQ